MTRMYMEGRRNVLFPHIADIVCQAKVAALHSQLLFTSCFCVVIKNHVCLASKFISGWLFGWSSFTTRTTRPALQDWLELWCLKFAFVILSLMSQSTQRPPRTAFVWLFIILLSLVKKNQFLMLSLGTEDAKCKTEIVVLDLVVQCFDSVTPILTRLCKKIVWNHAPALIWLLPRLCSCSLKSSEWC